MKRFLLILASAILILGCQKEVYHNITVSVNPTEGGTVSPSSGPVLDGTSISFKATPNGDYVFTGWSGSVSGTENPKTVTVSQDMNVTANFTLRSYLLTITIEGDGTVSEKVISTKSEYQSGTVVELTAIPSDRWLFDHWEGDITGAANPTQISVSSAKNVKAVFVEKTYPLNIEIEGEGAVSEKIIQTKATYQEGTVVELTANPSNGWSFDHWERDLEGDENPAQITVSAETNVKAIFTKNEYSFNVKIEGPGAVDEFLVEQTTKATLEYGKQIRLVAIPDETAGASFVGWSGDITSNNLEITVDIDDAKNITAEFIAVSPLHSLENLSLPSRSHPMIYKEHKYRNVTASPTLSVWLDYNRDGIMDIIKFRSRHEMDTRLPLEFLIGQNDGSYIVDKQNEGILGLIDSRKGIYGDYNGDGIPDVCIIGGGYDAPPYVGDYPLILLSDVSTGKYKDIRLVDNIGFWHGGTSADFDNDGDLDIFLICSWHAEAIFLINDGQGNFSVRKDLFNQDYRFGMYNAEMYDFDKDGYIDLVVGGHDHDRYSEYGRYVNMPIIFWGNGKTFSTENKTNLPATPIPGMGVVNDFFPYDIDNDNFEELILLRTSDEIGDPKFPIFYDGWCLQVLKRENREFRDITSQYIELDNCFQRGMKWMPWLGVKDNIVFSYDYDGDYFELFRIEDNKFYPIKTEAGKKYTAGFNIHSNGEILARSAGQYIAPVDIQLNPGHINGADLSELTDNDYVLEFSIKNRNPDMTIHVKFNSRLNLSGWDEATYAYGYESAKHPHDGEWETVQVKLNAMEEWVPDKSTNYWKQINSLQFLMVSDSYEDFYLKDIRVRRTLDAE